MGAAVVGGLVGTAGPAGGNRPAMYGAFSLITLALSVLEFPIFFPSYVKVGFEKNGRRVHPLYGLLSH